MPEMTNTGCLSLLSARQEPGAFPLPPGED